MPKSKLSAAARGYGWQHQQERERWRPVVEAGNAVCAERICISQTGRRIRPGTPWDMAHDRTTGAYLGPAHQGCNRREGAVHGNRNRNRGRRNRQTPAPVIDTTEVRVNSRDW